MENKNIEVPSISIGVLSFILVLFGFVEGVILVLGFAILAQKDKWLTKQVLEALYLRIFYLVAILLVGWFFKGILSLLNLIDAYGVMEGVSKIQSFIEGLIYIGLLVLVIMGIMKILKGQDANIPLVTNFVARTLGEKRTTIKTDPKSQQVYQGYGEVSTDDSVWRCNCGAENSGNFCMSCGLKRGV